MLDYPYVCGYSRMYREAKPDRTEGTQAMFTITRDGETVATAATDSDVLAWFHRNVSYSMDHAVTYEGYAVTETPDGYRATIARDLPNGSYIEVTAEERDASGTLSPGFSVTAYIWEKYQNASGRARKRAGRDIDAGGMAHGEALAAFPELAPIVAVHLAGQDGKPMYAKENGFHFYSGAASEYERRQIAAGRDYGYSRLLEASDHDRAARALRIAPAELPEGMDRTAFDAFVDSLAERYAAEAATARAVLHSLTDGEGVESV